MVSDTVLETVLKRDRRIVLGAMASLVALSVTYLLLGAGTGMSPFAMTNSAFPPYVNTLAGMVDPQAWSAGYWLIMIVMWWVMMIAMMTPSAAPMVLLHATIVRRGGSGMAGKNPSTATALFLAGYLLIWFGFAVLATALEAVLERFWLMSPMFMWSESGHLTGAVLVLAGAFQFTQLKTTCLDGCRSPLEFLSRNWRAGATGAFRIGLIHGAYCLGCCWALMLLLFAGGVMNLLWIAGLSLLVLIEKLSRYGRAFGRMVGLMAFTLGILLLFNKFP